jgi:antitoxin VapB
MYTPRGYTRKQGRGELDGIHQHRSQAVRLPKAVAFPEDAHQVDVLKIGRSRVIVPQGKRWDDLFENGPRASGDFMSEGGEPAAEVREPL